jgi:hypothetical protein
MPITGIIGELQNLEDSMVAWSASVVFDGVSLGSYWCLAARSCLLKSSPSIHAACESGVVWWCEYEPLLLLNVSDELNSDVVMLRCQPDIAHSGCIPTVSISHSAKKYQKYDQKGAGGRTRLYQGVTVADLI